MAKLPRVEGGKKEKVSDVSNQSRKWATETDGKRSVHKAPLFTLDQPSRNKPTFRLESEWGPLHSKAQHSTHQKPAGHAKVLYGKEITYYHPC